MNDLDEIMLALDGEETFMQTSWGGLGYKIIYYSCGCEKFKDQKIPRLRCRNDYCHWNKILNDEI